MASTYLTRTQSAGNRKTFTISTWVKRSSITTNQAMLSCDTGVADDTGWIEFRFQGNGDSIHLSGYDTNFFRTNRACRDTNGWMHIVVAVDTTQATASNRIKLYVNGVQETSFATQTQPSQNADLPFNTNNIAINLGKHPTNSSNYFDGSMSHFHFIDGTAYDASSFGETDTTTGEWKAKTSPSVTYGNNGFLILKDGNTITDQSSNSNDFTLGGGTLTDLKDNPDNTFATLNPLASTTPPANVGFTLSNGNNTAQYTNTSYANFTPSTIGFNKGKWYAECKVSADGSFGGDWPEIGVFYSDNISDIQRTNEGSHIINSMVNGASIVGNGTLYKFGTQTSSYFSGFSTNNIISVAVDSDTGKIWWAVNGTFINSGNPTNGTNENATATANKSLIFYSRWYQASNNTIVKWNFGNGYFGTTAVSSAGTNASENGIFEYDVPTGYTALSTKGLNL